VTLAREQEVSHSSPDAGHQADNEISVGEHQDRLRRKHGRQRKTHELLIRARKKLKSWGTTNSTDNIQKLIIPLQLNQIYTIAEVTVLSPSFN
jgi:hypothetical protein